MKVVFIIVPDKVVGSSYMDIVDSPDRIRFNGRRARPAHCFLFVLFPPDPICSHIFCISSYAVYLDLHFKWCNMYYVFPPPSFSLAFPICIVSPRTKGIDTILLPK